MNWLRKGNHSKGAAFFLLILWLSGCASLPEVSPFVEATVQLRSAMVASGIAVGTELRQTPGVESKAEELSRLWEVRIHSADALVSYSESLAAIVRSGREGGDAAAQLADSVTGLSQAVGVIMPQATVVATATDTAKFVYTHIAAARASQSLEKALVNVQPAIQQIVRIMGEDLKLIEDILLAAHQLQMTAVNEKYNLELGYLKSLRREQREIYQKTRRSREEEKRLTEIDQLMEATKPWRAEYEKEKEEGDKRLRAGRQLLAGTRQSLTEWGFAHQQLIGAVREKRTVEVAALVQATQEVRELIRRIREL